MENIYIAKSKKPSKIPPTIGLFLAVVFGIAYFIFLSAPAWRGNLTEYTVSRNADRAEILAGLKSDGYIKNLTAFELVLKIKKVENIIPGSYKISKSMNASEIARILSGKPALVWVVIPEGLRKEEIADILAKALAWTDAQKKTWIHTDTNPDKDHFEGVYFPETYLIPTNETPADTAKRLRAKFEEKYAPLAPEAQKVNLKWTVALKVASLIQREAAGTADMKIISGIIWNRLDKDMRLQIDATVQYARGNTGEGWWAPLHSGDTSNTDSPYNTYQNSGLPPTPIDNPGLDAIEAAINPADTKCIYYLHDNDGNIHCSVTYEEQQANVEKYLK